MGLTFKEDVPDTRNSKAKELTDRLKAQGSLVFGHDPMVRNLNHLDYFNISIITDWPPKELFDCVVIFSPHKIFGTTDYSLNSLKAICSADPIIFDIKGFYDKNEAESLGFIYFTL